MSANPIGHRLRAQRKAMGLTQTALAKRVGISVSYVNLIEHDRRAIGGALLRKLAEALDLDPGALDGAAERRLLQELDETTADPAVAHLGLDAAESRELVARFEPWARALAALRRTALRDQQIIAALSDRLNHDPFLSEAVHRMLSAAAAIRSVTDIYAEEKALDPAQRARFDAILGEESGRLSEVAQSLAAFFDQRERPGRAATAAEEVDDLLQQRGNYFPALEDAAEALRRREDLGDRPEAAALRAALERHGGRLSLVSADALTRWRRHDRETGLLAVAQGAPLSTLRFELARALCAAALSEAVEEALDDAEELVSEDGRARARDALEAYAAACLLTPYALFHEAARDARYDIDALTMRFGVSAEQLCHRFTTLRRPGEEGVRFGFLRANAAGYLTKRLPLPRMPLPRFGGACPLLAVYLAMQTPDVRLRQLAEFPGGDRFFIVARATRPRASGFGRTQPSFALMLACDVLEADRLVYSDGLDLSPRASAEPVGPTCALCPREGCAHRQEDSIRPAHAL